MLPYEKNLIEALGCTEEEYRTFVQQVERHYRERGKEYAHIPDVRCDPITIAIGVGLGVGLLATAAAVLLTPKPKVNLRAQETEGLRRKQLAGSTGTNVFAPTLGFDTTQSLAEYGQMVPIVFTRQLEDTETEKITGGLVISPQLVWSRMKSWGSYQVAELNMVVGQGPIGLPDLQGIFLGNNALDAMYEDFYDFYWNDGSSSSSCRILGADLKYGELKIDGNSAQSGIGDPDEVFYASTLSGANQPAFCGSFTPTSHTSFGCFMGVPNGTPFRPDWKIISIPQEYSDKQKRQAKNEQKRYVDPYLMDTHKYGNNAQDTGNWAIHCGMPGKGTAYARRIGVISHTPKDGVEVTVPQNNIKRDTSKNGHESWYNLMLEQNVGKGDTIKILIGKGEQSETPFPMNEGDFPVDLTDVKTAVQAECQRYDELFSIGSTWMIGRSTWMVTMRGKAGDNNLQIPFDPLNDTQVANGVPVTLVCMESWSDANNRIGLVAERAITEPDYVPYMQEGDDIHEAFYNLCKYEIGTFQNTRACEVTEIGIKSNVWVKFGGITHFNQVPSPGIMAIYNEENVVITAGKQSGYSHRMSLFVIDVRPSNYEVKEGDKNFGWQNLDPVIFAVVGKAPVDQYNFVRIQHPKKIQLEYRFRPFPAAVFCQGPGDFDVFVLDGGRTGLEEWTSETKDYGDFPTAARGYFAQPRDFFTHREMAAIPSKIFGDDESEPIRFNVVDAADQAVKLLPFPKRCVNVSIKADGVYSTLGIAPSLNTLSNIYVNAGAPDPWGERRAAGEKYVLENWNYHPGQDDEVKMRLHLVCFHDYDFTDNKHIWWRLARTELVSTRKSWTSGQTFGKRSQNANGVIFEFTYVWDQPSSTKAAAKTISATRLWEKFSGLAEVTHYGDLISRSCDSAPEHEIVYVNESMQDTPEPQYQQCAMAGLKLQSSGQFQSLDQLRVYVKNGVSVERLNTNDKGPSNLLTDLFYYLCTNRNTGAGGLINPNLVDKAGLTLTGSYLKANKLFWDDVITDSVNLRSWLTEQAPSVLCYVALTNGKINLVPALPYDDTSFEIDSLRPATVKGMFTDGNILEDTLEYEWLDLDERQMFQVNISYIKSRENQFPEQVTLNAYYASDATGEASLLPSEDFTFTHIHGDAHAAMVARYFLAVRKYLTHTITFKTLPWGLALKPGDIIRVSSRMSPYSPVNNGIIDANGDITSVTPIPTGDYNVLLWARNNTDGVVPKTLTVTQEKRVIVEANDVEGIEEVSYITRSHVENGITDAVFTVDPKITDPDTGETVTENQLYQIEALDIDNEGIVTIKASNYEVNSQGTSQVVLDTMQVTGAGKLITLRGTAFLGDDN